MSDDTAMSQWRECGLTSTEGGCSERAALAVLSTVPSGAVTDGTAAPPPGMNDATG